MSVKVFKSLIIGAPGSGKGTISSRIVKAFNMEYISSGDRLRQHIKDKTSIGLEASKYINEGQLVPDDIMIKFIGSELAKATKPWLLDGFPRTLSQAKDLWGKQNLDIVINLVVPARIIMERVEGRMIHLSSGRVYNNDYNPPKNPGFDDETGEPLTRREDDKPEVVKKRLELYETLTKPVLEFYKQHGILKEFEGVSSDVISPEVIKTLNNYLTPITSIPIRR